MKKMFLIVLGVSLTCVADVVVTTNRLGSLKASQYVVTGVTGGGGGGGVSEDRVFEIAGSSSVTNAGAVAYADAKTTDMEAIGKTNQIMRGRYYLGEWYDLKVHHATMADNAGVVAWDGIQSHPTTLSGYGITDAKIENGTITLGSQTITPIVLTQSYTLEVPYVSSTMGFDTAGDIECRGSYVVYGITTNGTDYLHADVDLSGLAHKADIEPTAESVFSSNADYVLTNLTGAAVSLASGHIGNVTLSNVQTNLALSLDFSSSANRSGDCMLLAMCGAETTLAVGPSHCVDILGSYDKLKAGTNVVMVTRMMMNGTNSVVLVNVKEVK